MGKSARLPPSSAVRTRKQRMKRPAAAGGGSCVASSVVLGLLVAFGLVLLTVFALTLRPGHGSLRNSSSSLEASEEIVREIELPHPNRVVSRDSLRVYGYEVVQEFDHDPTAFTQGLVYAGNGTLYESTGLYRRSSVREVDLQTGEVRQKYKLQPWEFGEGLTIWKNKLLQLVWKEKKVKIYDKDTLVPKVELPHQMSDGWGLTTNNDHIIGSDGTSKLYFMDPDTFEEVRVVSVTDGDRDVGWLNELEFVNNEIWANIWQGQCIARISPQDGKVTGWILLHGLRDSLLGAGPEDLDVLNGIAWDGEEEKVYVTGKMWPKLYQIRLLDRTQDTNNSLQEVRQICNIGEQGFQ